MAIPQVVWLALENGLPETQRPLSRWIASRFAFIRALMPRTSKQSDSRSSSQLWLQAWRSSEMTFGAIH